MNYIGMVMKPSKSMVNKKGNLSKNKKVIFDFHQCETFVEVKNEVIKLSAG